MPRSRILRRYSLGEKEPRFEIAPLVDVVFVLLIFFAVATSPGSNNNKGILLNLPSATTVAENKKGIVITVDADQKIFYEGQRISESAIRGRVARDKDKKTELQVTLNADRLTPYSLVIRVLDEVRKAGVFDIVLEAKKKADE